MILLRDGTRKVNTEYFNDKVRLELCNFEDIIFVWKLMSRI